MYPQGSGAHTAEPRGYESRISLIRRNVGRRVCMIMNLVFFIVLSSSRARIALVHLELTLPTASYPLSLRQKAPLVCRQWDIDP